MLEQFLLQRITYDGTQLASLWAFRNYGLQGDSIVSFRGPCRVELTEMVDLEDVRNRAPIFSTDMLHFIIEHFDLDLEKTIIRQRLLVSIIKDIIEQITAKVVERRGDDLFLNDRKLSVSIATLSPVSTMIHTGLNVSAMGVPVPAVGLIELGIGDEQIANLGSTVCTAYVKEFRGIRKARCKVRGVK